MKKLLLALLFAIAGHVHAQALGNATIATKVDPTASYYITYPMYENGSSGLYWWDTSAKTSYWIELGAGLSVSSNALQMAPTSGQITSGLGYTPSRSITLTTTGSGAATFNSGTGALNIPTPPAQTAFNYSQPTTRSLAVSTSYQATDTSKPAIIYPSFACTNATTVLAASACTVQVRMGTSPLTCSTGTVYYTQSLTVALGLLITQNSTNPVPIFLPAGAHFIICPTAGTFTISAVEQTAGN